MLELGKFSSEEHKRIGVIVAKSADILLTVGVRAKQIADGALSAGMSEKIFFNMKRLVAPAENSKLY